MRDLLCTVESIDDDLAAGVVWSWFRDRLREIHGCAYYRHPLIRSGGDAPPDLLIMPEGFNPLAIRCMPYRISDIQGISDATWTVGGRVYDSPILQTEDFVEGLKGKFNQHRLLRNLLAPVGVVALPNIARADFAAKFPNSDSMAILFTSDEVDLWLRSWDGSMSPEKWRLAQAVCQTGASIGVRPGSPATGTNGAAKTLGAAIAVLEREIALLDADQEKAAMQLPPGPQRIRGLAGTGKTVLLAMKAAQIHLRFPDRRILFTFNTKSLYNQSRQLITRFYRAYADRDPDWENRVHLRHAWGTKDTPGVYYDLASRLRLPFFDVRAARSRDPNEPLAACCEQLLASGDLPEDYEHVLVDEAQDLPASFFRLLYRITKPPHAIYWAYDELQKLSTVGMPSLTDLFGVGPDGQPIVSLEGEYPGQIEKDLVLQKSYRCPGKVLMLAHAIGLGLYAPRGIVQILTDENSWRSVGYELSEGHLTKNSPVVLVRPPENSPNKIAKFYSGDRDLVRVMPFATRDEEEAWVADSIANDVSKENVRPEDIMVVTLNAKTGRDHLARIQARLFGRGVQSLIPGHLHSTAAEFASPGMATLVSFYRAKGNEAPVVYVTNADIMAGYANEIEGRNRAFTAVSRAKGWVSISGAGPGMEVVVDELGKILADIPKFRFVFPDPDKIRRLDAETTRRRKQASRAKRAVHELLDIDPDAINDLPPETVARLRQLLGKG
jgi:superfamily I DNA and RNA helicase